MTTAQKQEMIKSIKFNLSLGGLSELQINAMNKTITDNNLSMDKIVYSEYLNS